MQHFLLNGAVHVNSMSVFIMLILLKPHLEESTVKPVLRGPHIKRTPCIKRTPASVSPNLFSLIFCKMSLY